MHIKIYILFLLTTISICGQQSWKWQNPLPQGKTINEISIIDSNNVYAAGDNGLLLKTIDGGVNWSITETGYRNNLMTVFFIDISNGWAAGENGIILHTTDGGLNYIRQDTGGVTYDINSIFFTSAEQGFAVCSNGVLLSTTNGGSSWTSTINNPQLSFSKIYFLNHDTGWLTGGNGIIKKTNDGGTTWTDENSGVNFILSSICFTDQNYGWMCGQNGQIIKTTDGGNNWNISNSSTNNWLLSISFVDHNTGIVAGRNGVILRTNDGGNSWNKEVHDSTFTFNSVSFLSTGTGWLAGSSGFLARSSDGGMNWEFLSSGDRVNLNSIYFITSDIGFIVGDKGTIYKTTDSGNTWVKKESNTNANLNDITYYKYYSYKDLWICGNNGTLLKSTDFGESWIGIDIKSLNLLHNNLLSISAESPRYCFVGGEEGTFFVISLLNGYSASNQSFSSDTDIRNLFMVAPSSIFFVGKETKYRQGTFMFFHLGFTPLNPSGSTTVGSDLSFSDLSQVTFLKTRGGFYASKYGFITGRFGVFLKSTDLGTTWKKSTLDITDGKGICFIDTLNGFICGSNGDLLKTIDGGSNWTKLTTHLRTTLSRIYFKDKLTGWIIGPNGLLIRTDNGGGFGAAENIRETNNLPNTFSLSQNFPNPFNPGTTINYSLSSEGHVSIKVYNILGEEISTIVNEKKGAGNYNIYFNGIGLPSGIYFYRIQAGDFSETRKMILLK